MEIQGRPRGIWRPAGMPGGFVGFRALGVASVVFKALGVAGVVFGGQQAGAWQAW